MIWYLNLFLIIIGPFVIYFIAKALQAYFSKSKEIISEAILVKKEIIKNEEIEKDIIFDEIISSKNETEYKLTFMLKNSSFIEFNVIEEDFNKYHKDSKGLLHYKKIIGIPSFMYFNIM